MHERIFLQKQRGFSLLELLLVLAIIATILLASFKRYKQYTLDKDIATVKQNVALLMNAMDAYYAQLSTNPATNPTLAITNNNLNSKNLWPTNSLLSSNIVKDKAPINYTTTDYIVSVSPHIGITPPPNAPAGTHYYTYKLIVTVSLDSNIVHLENLKWYANLLGASITNDNKLRWGKMPSYSVKGINSSLWIMQGGLASFKKYLAETSSQ